MSDHDPLCPCTEPRHVHYTYAPSRLCVYCRCALIAKVRADQTAKAIAAVEALVDPWPTSAPGAFPREMVLAALRGLEVSE